MTADQIKPGLRLILRGLPRKGTAIANRFPRSIGIVVTEPEDEGKFRCRLSMGSLGRWAPKSREVEVANVERIATPREVTLGMAL